MELVGEEGHGISILGLCTPRGLQELVSYLLELLKPESAERQVCTQHLRLTPLTIAATWARSPAVITVQHGLATPLHGSENGTHGHILFREIRQVPSRLFQLVKYPLCILRVGITSGRSLLRCSTVSCVKGGKEH